MYKANESKEWSKTRFKGPLRGGVLALPVVGRLEAQDHEVRDHRSGRRHGRLLCRSAAPCAGDEQGPQEPRHPMLWGESPPGGLQRHNIKAGEFDSDGPVRRPLQAYRTGPVQGRGATPTALGILRAPEPFTVLGRKESTPPSRGPERQARQRRNPGSGTRASRTSCGGDGRRFPTSARLRDQGRRAGPAYATTRSSFFYVRRHPWQKPGSSHPAGRKARLHLRPARRQDGRRKILYAKARSPAACTPTTAGRPDRLVRPW